MQMSKKSRNFALAKNKKQPFKNPEPMGKTADIMTRNDALKIRSFLTWLFNMDEEPYLHAAIAKTYSLIDLDDWSVFIYGNHLESSFLIEAATLCNALDNIVSSFRTSIGQYDAGTTEPDIRCAVILR